MDLNGKNILITGATGSFGQNCVATLLKNFKCKKIIIFSRDELKQSVMQESFNSSELRYFLGDVRDLPRLNMAMRDVDVVIHAAALKQVPAIEYNPFEAVRTNIIGAYNVISASLSNNVEKVIALSTDKAANPVNLYGATKLCSDKLFIDGNYLSGSRETKFSVVRYGNVFGSRGSVIPVFLRQKASGEIKITDPRMTRFFITLDQGVDFVIKNLSRMVGGEIFVPKIPSVKILDIAQAVAPECKQVITGIRPGEKLHETMIPEDDSRQSLEFKDYFVIQPQTSWWNREKFETRFQSDIIGPCKEDFVYKSDTNHSWLNITDISNLVAQYQNQSS